MVYHLSTGVKAPPSKSFRTMVNRWIMLRVFWSRHILKLPKVQAYNCQGALQLKVGQPHGWSWEGHCSGFQGPRKAANHIWQTFVLCWRRFGTVVLCFRVPLQWESDSHWEFGKWLLGKWTQRWEYTKSVFNFKGVPLFLISWWKQKNKTSITAFLSLPGFHSYQLCYSSPCPC